MKYVLIVIDKLNDRLYFGPFNTFEEAENSSSIFSKEKYSLLISPLNDPDKLKE